MSFQTLEIASTVLSASRAALEIASQNVANANTPGYVRQRAVFVPLVNPDPGGGIVAGGGVSIATIQRLRDQCLEAQIDHQEGQLGSEQALGQSLNRVQNYFPDLAGTGISSSLGATFNSLQTLQTTPDSLTARNDVIFNAEGLCTQLHEAVSKLQDEGNMLDSDLVQRVDRTNTVLQQVAELNGKIISLGDSPTGNDLRVMREEAIRELAGLCGTVGLDQPNGAQDVLVGGIRLVQGTQCQQLSLITDPADSTRHQVSVVGLTDIPALGGAIAGDIEARDTRLAGWQDRLDQLAQGVADAFNTQHRAGYDLDGNAGGDFFSYDPAHAAATVSVSATLSANSRLLAASSTVDGSAGDGVNAAQMAALRQSKVMNGGSQTLEAFHSDTLYDIGSQTQRAATAVEARQSLLSALDTQYTDQAGVSLDEEAVDIMRYQQTYNAAARMIKTANDMLDKMMELV
jgi:flagellar hook-associated protein 1